MDKSIVPVNHQIAVRSSTYYEFSNPNEAKVVEIEDDPVENVEKQMKDLKLNQQFNETNVPQIFQNLMNEKMNRLKKIDVRFYNDCCTMKFDDINIRFDKIGNDWLLSYKNETIKTNDHEKSIIDHLWFVLRNSNLKLRRLFVGTRCYSDKTLVHEKTNEILQSMLDSIDHQISTVSFEFKHFDEDTFFSMLKHIKPKTLSTIDFEISWKEERNYQKMKEIVEMDQWKQAKKINSLGVTPLKTEDLFHCRDFRLTLDSVTPEDVLRVCEHFFNFTDSRSSWLYSRNNDVSIDAIIEALRSQNDGLQVNELESHLAAMKFFYEIVKSTERLSLNGAEEKIFIKKD